ncbi:saccharopine dehydrogenase C-terminal domain-containing protein [Agriterribacter sp.]|uniref:saccharopine dehydrogenase family protein n=1 Tax=Agriterribacter sp. TaxID=2821509 RepID=UPI002C8AFF00|nr:saccharopine dehydrogenase C-terminal domain-containing protein [Agriterribacter sp.]HRO45000.1 saccharopine dehydrogenase C-terminal domain-containing protein [Agriterribacter sp.]HRQ15737.1 saccharopine dehydrogenase C-terminal domain-containing protein [Agriterribacter sp.]
MKIAVLGAGMVGRAIAEDLSTSFEVTSFDKNSGSLALLAQRAPSVKTEQANLSELASYNALLKPFELVVTAVPGFMGFGVLKQVIAAGKNVVDISFSPENTLQLDALAKENSVTAIVDCGVAPGMSNLVLGRYNEEMKVDNFECYVGGLPKIRKKPFEYKAPFSPVDVIEEYTRPARLVENGQMVTKAALTEIELMDFEGVGTLEAFNTDGLRSIIDTMKHIPNMKEKTLRYPGHCELIIALQRSGFFDKKRIAGKGIDISPLEYTSAILFKEWKLQPGEEEFTVMKIIVQGEQEGKRKTVEYALLDHYDVQSQTTSMARSTGYTCTAAVHLIAKKLFAATGVFPPEKVGSNKACFNHIIQYLKERKVNWEKREYA